MSSFITLRLLIRSVVAYRAAYSLWISCPAYLLSLYHMPQQETAKVSVTGSLDLSPLKLARVVWQQAGRWAKKLLVFLA